MTEFEERPRWEPFVIGQFIVVSVFHPTSTLINLFLLGPIVTVDVPGNFIQLHPLGMALCNLIFGLLRFGWFHLQIRPVPVPVSLKVFANANISAVGGAVLFFILLMPIEGNIFGFFLFPFFAIAIAVVEKFSAKATKHAIAGLKGPGSQTESRE